MTIHMFFGFLFLSLHSLGLVLGLARLVRRLKTPSIFSLGMKLVFLESIIALMLISLTAILFEVDFFVYYIYLSSLILSTLAVILFFLAGPGLAERSLTMFLVSIVDSSPSGREIDTLRELSQIHWWDASDQTQLRVSEQIDAGIFQLNENGCYEVTRKGKLAANLIQMINKIFDIKQPNNL